MNTAELRQLVAKKFPPGAYGLLWEVGNGTGFACNRHCDGLVMSLWPSRGLELLGLELKVSRGDWIKERDNPAKAESIAKFCDRWYLVVGDAGIVHAGELPPNWGLIAPKGKGLATIKEAPRLKPPAVSREFLAAIFRRASEQSVDAQVVKSAHAAGYAEGKEYAQERQNYAQQEASRELERLRETLKTFREETGIPLTQHAWNGDAKKVGRAVRLVLDGKHRRDLDELAAIEAAAERAKAAVIELRAFYAKEET